MFEEHDDRRAAEKIFLSILKGSEDTKNNPRLDPRLNKELLKKQVPFFIKGFFFAYRKAMSSIKLAKVRDKPAFFKTVVRVFLNADEAMGNYKYIHFRKNDEENNIISVGQALGYFLAGVEGIINPYFELGEKGEEAILSEVKKIKSSMIFKRIRISFILKRVNKIARKHGKNLTNDQKELLAAIAAILSE